jgi:hypothetical protein
MWFWLLLALIPTVLIIIVFLVAHGKERELPIIDRRLSLSVWVGAVSLLPGLLHVRPFYGGPGVDLTFGSASQLRGWPLPWWGYRNEALSFVPFSILVNLSLVAAIAFICLSIVRILERRWPRRVSRERIYPPLALVLVLFPVWGPLLMETYNTYQEQEVHRQYVMWLERNAEPAINSIQLQECKDFDLIPSSEQVGTMNIRLYVSATVNEPHDFELSAHILHVVDDRESSMVIELLKQQLPVGEHTLEFILHPVDVDSGYIRIDKPGPYKIPVVVNQVSVEQSRFGNFFGSEEFRYARDNLGIVGDKLRLECQSPPYTLADLGLPLDPTSQP